MGLRCDVLDFEGMLKLPFDHGRASKIDNTFLKPGELERILGYKQTKTHKRRRERL
jgi:hypothetical protein